MNGSVTIWLPVDPLVFGVFGAILVLFLIIWLWKLVVSLVTGA